MLSWVFNPLQGSYSLSLRSPHFDRMGVAPLLLRRLIRFIKSLFSSCVKNILVTGFPFAYPHNVPFFFAFSTYYLAIAFIVHLPTRRFHLTAITSMFVSAKYATSLRVLPIEFCFNNRLLCYQYTKQLQPSLFLFCFYLTKNQTLSLDKCHPS
jgi:hypothetical protein